MAINDPEDQPGDAAAETTAAPTGGGPPTVTIDPASLATIVNAISTAISNGIASATGTARTPDPPQPQASKTYSTSIDPYDTQSLDVDTKDGKYQWSTITKREDGWKPASVNVETADMLLDLLKDRQVQFGLDAVTQVPMEGTSMLASAPRTIAGVDYYNADLRAYKDLLKDVHTLDLDDVEKFSGYIFGDAVAGLGKSTDMVVKALDANAPGNQGLVNRHKIRLRRLSGALHFILKNHITRTSYVSFWPMNARFLYTDEVTGRKIVCGLVLVKLAMGVMKPQLVVNYREKEKELEVLSLASCGNNVRTLLTKMQEKKEEIDSLRKDGVTFDDQRFLTLIFDKLLALSCADFVDEVKRSRNAWVKDPASTDANSVIADHVNLFTNFKANGEWTKESIDKDATILALATQLKKERAKNASEDRPAVQFVPSDKTGTGGSKSPGLPEWRLKHRGDKTTCPDTGDRFVWCPYHGHKGKDGKHSGMYMPDGHDHDAWVKAKKEKNDAFKARLRDRAAKRKAQLPGKATDTDKKHKGGGSGESGKLALTKSMKSALVTKVQLSDAEVDELVNGALASCSPENDVDPSDN